MPSASTTQSRLYPEGNKVRCGCKTHGRPCNAVVMIDGKIACKNGHKFSIYELISVLMGANDWATIVHWVFAMITRDPGNQSVFAKQALEKVFSPPYSTALASSDGETYHWPDWQPIHFQLLCIMARWYAPEYEEVLRRQFIERTMSFSRSDGLMREAFKILSRSHKFADRARREAMIECILHRGFFPPYTLDELRSRCFVECEARRVTKKTDELWWYEDGLDELDYAATSKLTHPVIFADDDTADNGRWIFHLYLRDDEHRFEPRCEIRLYKGGMVETRVLQSRQTARQVPTDHHISQAVKKAWGRLAEIMDPTLDNGPKVKNQALLSEPRWQLKVLADIRYCLGLMNFETEA